MAASTSKTETAVEQARASAEAALAKSEQSLHELTKRFEKTVHEGVEALKAQTRGYTDQAGERIETAQKYITERVQEKPLAATFTALGVGVLVGLLISANRR